MEGEKCSLEIKKSFMLSPSRGDPTIAILGYYSYSRAPEVGGGGRGRGGGGEGEGEGEGKGRGRGRGEGEYHSTKVGIDCSQRSKGRFLAGCSPLQP